MDKIADLKFTDGGFDTVCSLCGGYNETDIGLELFTEDGVLICDDCAAVCAPELLAARIIVKKDETYLDVTTENEYTHTNREEKSRLTGRNT